MTDSRVESNPLVVTRWTRYGHDRAYVAVGATRLGYRDLRSGEIVCDLPVHRATVEDASDELWHRARAARYVPRHAMAASTGDAVSTGTGNAVVVSENPPTVSAGVAAPAGPSIPPVAAPDLLPDRDLAANRPGEAVRARAVALRDAAPVSSRVARVLGVKTDERSWRIGADAEEAVAKRLSRLGPQWRMLHSIPVGERGSDIDHVVIGPAGVFVVNAKNHPDANVWVRGDTVKVNGFHQPYVRNSRFEARRAARLLSARVGFDVEVRGLVAVMGMQKGFTVVEQPADVVILERKHVAAHLASLPPVLGEPSVARIHDVARHLATWQPRTVAWADPLPGATADR